MEDKTSPEDNNDLYKCPHCACCFCSEADLQRHIDAYGDSKAEHIGEFKKVHGRLEHGSYNEQE